jgi:hypothetical protein
MLVATIMPTTTTTSDNSHLHLHCEDDSESIKLVLRFSSGSVANNIHR